MIDTNLTNMPNHHTIITYPFVGYVKKQKNK